MANVTIQIQCPKEADDFIVAIKNLVLAAVAGKLDLATELQVAVQLAGEYKLLPNELKAQPYQCAASLAVHGLEIAQALAPVAG